MIIEKVPIDELIKNNIDKLFQEGAAAIREKNHEKVYNLNCWIEVSKRMLRNLKQFDTLNVKLNSKAETDIFNILEDKIGIIKTIYGNIELDENFRASILEIDKINLVALSDMERDQRKILKEIEKNHEGLESIIQKSDCLEVKTPDEPNRCEPQLELIGAER